MSIEGQADYEGARTCMKRLLPKFSYGEDTSTSYMQDQCNKRYPDDYERYESCLRTLQAGISAVTLQAKMQNVSKPNYSTPDRTVVSETIMGYPNIQCRLDTYRKGALNYTRPACWFKN